MQGLTCASSLLCCKMSPYITLSSWFQSYGTLSSRFPSATLWVPISCYTGRLGIRWCTIHPLHAWLTYSHTHTQSIHKHSPIPRKPHWWTDTHKKRTKSYICLKIFLFKTLFQVLMPHKKEENISLWSYNIIKRTNFIVTLDFIDAMTNPWMRGSLHQYVGRITGCF